MSLEIKLRWDWLCSCRQHGGGGHCHPGDHDLTQRVAPLRQPLDLELEALLPQLPQLEQHQRVPRPEVRQELRVNGLDRGLITTSNLAQSSSPEIEV